MTGWCASINRSADTQMQGKGIYSDAVAFDKKSGRRILWCCLPIRFPKMVKCAVAEAKNKKIEIVRSHTSSQAALRKFWKKKEDNG